MSTLPSDEPRAARVSSGPHRAERDRVAEGPSDRRRVVVGYLALAGLVAGGLWIALGAASSELIVDTAGAEAPSWIAGPLSGLAPGLTDTGFSLAAVAMFAGYLAALSCARAVSPRWALAAVGLLVLAFTLTSPILSSDLFGYLGYARLGVLHHLNPYQHGVDAAPHDPVFELVYWQHPTSPYGPLFTVGSYALAPRSLPFGVWTLKALGGLACLVSVALAWWCARRMGRDQVRATLLLGGNPLLLVYAVGGAHNDLIVMAIVLGALSLLAAERVVSAGAALAGALAVKATAGIVLPFVLLGARARGRLLIGMLALGVPLAAMTLAVFGTHVLDTIGHIATGNSFNVEYSGPDLLGRLLGTGITPGVRAIGAAVALAVWAFCLWSVWRRRMEWLDGAGWTTLAALCAIASFVPWYLAWILPIGALSRSPRLRIAIVAFTAVVLALHLPLFGFPESQ